MVTAMEGHAVCDYRLNNAPGPYVCQEGVPILRKRGTVLVLDIGESVGPPPIVSRQ
jgi:hypothetical protein